MHYIGHEKTKNIGHEKAKHAL